MLNTLLQRQYKIAEEIKTFPFSFPSISLSLSLSPPPALSAIPISLSTLSFYHTQSCCGDLPHVQTVNFSLKTQIHRSLVYNTSGREKTRFLSHIYKLAVPPHHSPALASYPPPHSLRIIPFPVPTSFFSLTAV